MFPLILLGIGSLAAWSAWFFVLFRFDPFASGIAAIALFYVSFTLAFFGSVILGTLCIHRVRGGIIPSRTQVGAILRQTFLLTVFIVAVLVLMAAHLIRWWNIIPLALAVILIEGFLRSLNRGAATARR